MLSEACKGGTGGADAPYLGEIMAGSIVMYRRDVTSSFLVLDREDGEGIGVRVTR